MSKLVQVVYSPVCNVDTGAYERYLDCLRDVSGGAQCTVVSVLGASVSGELGSGGDGGLGYVSDADIGNRDGIAGRWRVVCDGDATVGRRLLEDAERRTQLAHDRVGRSSVAVDGSGDASVPTIVACTDQVHSDVTFARGGSGATADGTAGVRIAVPVSVDVSGEAVEQSGKYVPPHARGQEVARGKHYASNKAARERRKRNKGVVRDEQVEAGILKVDYGTFAACSLDQREELQRTRAQRLVAENELKTAEAQRKLELLRAQDVAQLKKRQETKLMRDTELNKVQVEQAFSKLAGTGNVPGFAQTVVTDGSVPSLQSGSISPNSSISAAEVHAMQKENLELQRRQGLLLKENPELYAKLNAVKLPSEQTGWTVDENGCPTGWIGDAVGGMIGPDGRLHDYDDYAEY